ncbi:YcaO-like family protein [Mesorhizobium sp. B2-1-8]|uniref:YcaO-like family protein n=1 Tax=Mesorhizobium sp. B2-1-8 TaxID=2589967 RepID=UPI001D110558|nr:YcaO-like family protein [Mesorhizobium sp. B2-1-8]UCI21369.1 YcaO-like family protein [Mesorhizobium sp. B2-1-8]
MTAVNAFELAARFYSQPQELAPEQDAMARGLLGALGYLGPSDTDPDPMAANNRRGLLHAAANFGNLFRLHARYSPGLYFFGAQVNRNWAGSPSAASASFSGVGLTPGRAFEACIGEGIEYHSEWHVPHGTMNRTIADGISHWQDARLAEHLDDFCVQSGFGESDRWVPVRRLDDGRQGYLPETLFIRGANRSAWVTSCGCAAGITHEAALTSALLETIERDAAAAWWRSRRGGRLIGLEALARAGVPDLLARIRQDKLGRCTQFLDISGEFPAPVTAALSFDADGRHLAVGLACRLDAGNALRAALLEMCQMELAIDLMAMKRAEHGDEKRDEVERLQSERSEASAMDTDLVSHLSSGLLMHKNDEKDLNFLSLVGEMLKKQYCIYAVDLTTPMFDIPVAKVFVPGLQPFPSPFQSRRLRCLIDQAGPSGRADLM